MIAQRLVVLGLAATGLYAGWSDAQHRRLSNTLVFLTAISGFVLTAVTVGITAAGSGLLHAAVAVLVGLPLFARGYIGGGDVKYYAAVAAWFPIGHGLQLLALVSLAGFMLTLGWLVWRRLVHKPHAGLPGQGADNVPFGIAIACGALLAAIGNLL